MDIYYEIADCAVEKFGSKYLVQHEVRDRQSFYFNVMRMANRAWLADGPKVELVKNRYTGILDDAINLKEFFWITLRAATVKQSSPWKV